MISLSEYEGTCYRNDCRASCPLFKDCMNAKIASIAGYIMKGSEKRYEELKKFWRKEKLEKLLAK